MKIPTFLLSLSLLLCQGIDSTIGNKDPEPDYDDLNFQMFNGEKHTQQYKRSTPGYTLSRNSQPPPPDYDEEEPEDDLPDLSQGEWKWCLLYLTGNATILQIRKSDFIKYLRINLASLISSSYDHVFFNSISYTPAILVNVSLNFKESRHGRILSSLQGLSKHNDTLFDLSGTHYNLTDFLPSYALTAPKSEVTPFASAADSDASSSNGPQSASEIEALIYIVVGGALSLLLTASLLFTVCQCVVLPQRRRREESDLSTHSSRRRSEYSLDSYQHRTEYTTSSNLEEKSPSRSSSLRSQPKLIYSRGFSDSLLGSPADTDVTAMTPSVSGHSSSFLVEADYGLRRSRMECREEDKPLISRDVIYHRNQDGEEDNLAPLRLSTTSSRKPASVIGGSMDYQTILIGDSSYNNSSSIPRPSSALSSFKPLPPPASFATPPHPLLPPQPPLLPPQCTLSPTSSTASSRSGQPPRKWSRINKPSEEEIARDVQIVFQNMGLESRSHQPPPPLPPPLILPPPKSMKP